MKLSSTIDLYAAGDSWLVHPPGLVTDTPQVRDIARKRLVKTNPDVDAGGPGSGRHRHGGFSMSSPGQRIAHTKLVKAGFTFEGRKGAINSEKNWYARSDGQRIAIHNTGNWDHGTHGKGTLSQLRGHLKLVRRVNAAKLKYKEKSQTDENAFVGKKLRVQDTKYGHLVSEHDNESSAQQAMLARPYSRILRHPEPQFDPKNRAKTRKKLVNKNPDMP